MAILKSQPARLHTAFNPSIWFYTKEGSDQPRLLREIKDMYGDTLAQLEVEFINGKATIDAESILSKSFRAGRTKRTYWTPSLSFDFPNLFEDHQLVFPYELTEINGFEEPKFAINAVSQFGESQDLTTRALTFLTGFDKIIRYEGYEYALSFLASHAAANEPTYLNQDGLFEEGQLGAPVNLRFLEDDAIENPHFTLLLDAQKWVELSNGSTDYFLRDDWGVIVTDNWGVPVLVDDTPATYLRSSLPIETRTAPSNSFYVRWLNRMGGWDAWMFGCRHYYSRSLESTRTFKTYFEDVETVGGDRAVYGKTGVEKVKVSSGQINRNEHDVISALIYSPVVEWYDNKKGVWITLILDKADTEIGSHKPGGECRFTFTLPEPQIQF